MRELSKQEINLVVGGQLPPIEKIYVRPAPGINLQGMTADEIFGLSKYVESYR